MLVVAKGPNCMMILPIECSRICTGIGSACREDEYERHAPLAHHQPEPLKVIFATSAQLN